MQPSPHASIAMRAVRTLILIASGVIFFAASAAILRNVLPAPLTTEADRRRLVFERASPPYDTVFLGTSRTYRGLDPAAFDTRTAAAGRPTHSFNFGLFGLRLFEARRVLKDLLAADREDRLRFVFLEMPPANWALERENLQSDRVIRYHDWRTFVDILRYLNQDPQTSVWSGWPRVVPLMENQANRGLGAAAFQSLAAGEDGVDDFIEQGAAELGDRGDGFQPLDQALSRADGDARERMEERHRLLLPSPEEWEESIEKLRKQLSAHQTVTDVAIELLAELSALVDQQRATPIFYLAPGFTPQWDVRGAHERGSVPALLAFDDPDRYPELYDRSLYFDKGHLNERGAELFSVVLADAFLDLQGP
jgi:hypothetical protein